MVFGLCISLFRGFPKPLGCFSIVLRDALAIAIAHAEIVLPPAVPLVCRLLKTLDRLIVVLRDASAANVASSKGILRKSASLLRGLPEPFNGFSIVLRNPVAIEGLGPLVVINHAVVGFDCYTTPLTSVAFPRWFFASSGVIGSAKAYEREGQE